MVIQACVWSPNAVVAIMCPLPTEAGRRIISPVNCDGLENNYNEEGLFVKPREYPYLHRRFIINVMAYNVPYRLTSDEKGSTLY